MNLITLTQICIQCWVWYWQCQSHRNYYQGVSQCYILFTQTRYFLTSYCSQRPFGLKKQWHNLNMKSQVQKHHITMYFLCGKNYQEKFLVQNKFSLPQYMV